MATPLIISGDDIRITARLKKDGLPFTIDSGATVLAALINTKHTDMYMTPVAQSSSTLNANWSNSEVIVIFTPAQTAGITYQGKALLELQIDDNGKTSFFGTVKIITGQIA